MSRTAENKEESTPLSGGYASRGAERMTPVVERKVSSLETGFSTLRKLISLWGAQARRDAPRQALEAYQTKNLRKTLKWAGREVPLYREIWKEAGVQVDEIRSVHDLQRLPILSKDDIRDAFPQGCTREGTDFSRCRIQQTSGSSGICMEIALSLHCDDMRNIYSQRVYGWHGFHWNRKIAYLFPYRLPFENNLSIYRNFCLDASRHSDEILDELEKIRPVALAATPSDILNLLEGMGRKRDLRMLGFKALCLHSEPISKDEKSYFESQFGCPVRQNYYCNEVWAIAAECDQGSMHQFMDNVILEIVNDDGVPVPPGEVGHAIVTGLNNYVQPFIRYRVGDLVAWDPEKNCACGSGLPILKPVEGRDDDYFIHPNGKKIHPSSITVAFKSPCFDYPGLQIFRDYQMIQRERSHVEVYVVPGRDQEHFNECVERGVRNLEQLMAPGVSVQASVGDSIPPGLGGKRKIFSRECS